MLDESEEPESANNISIPHINQNNSNSPNQVNSIFNLANPPNNNAMGASQPMFGGQSNNPMGQGMSNPGGFAMNFFTNNNNANANPGFNNPMQQQQQPGQNNNILANNPFSMNNLS